MGVPLLIIFALASTIGVDSLSLRGVRCGQLTCDLHDYCSPLESRCSPCSTICDDSNHNYDMSMCLKECQDYLHDMRYIKRSESASSGFDEVESQKAAIQNLQMKNSVMIVIVSIILALHLAFFGFKFFRFMKTNYKKLSWAWIRKKMQSPKKAVPKTMVEVIDSRKNETSTAIASEPQSLNVQALQVATTTPRRQAAEDASLDYSYDNMALNLTPPPQTASRQVQI